MKIKILTYPLGCKTFRGSVFIVFPYCKSFACSETLVAILTISLCLTEIGKTFIYKRQHKLMTGSNFSIYFRLPPCTFLLEADLNYSQILRTEIRLMHNSMVCFHISFQFTGFGDHWPICNENIALVWSKTSYSRSSRFPIAWLLHGLRVWHLPRL